MYQLKKFFDMNKIFFFCDSKDFNLLYDFLKCHSFLIDHWLSKIIQFYLEAELWFKDFWRAIITCYEKKLIRIKYENSAFNPCTLWMNLANKGCQENDQLHQKMILMSSSHWNAILHCDIEIKLNQGHLLCFLKGVCNHGKWKFWTFSLQIAQKVL